MVVTVGKRLFTRKALGVHHVTDKQEVRANIHRLNKVAREKRAGVLRGIRAPHRRGLAAILLELVVISARTEPEVPDVGHVGRLIDSRHRERTRLGNHAGGDVFLVDRHRNPRRRCRDLHGRIDHASRLLAICLGGHHIEPGRHREESGQIHTCPSRVTGHGQRAPSHQSKARGTTVEG